MFDRFFFILDKILILLFVILTSQIIITFNETISFRWYKTINTFVFNKFMFKITTISVLRSINFIKLRCIYSIDISIEYSIFRIIILTNSVNISFIISNFSSSNMSLSNLIANFQISNHFKFTSIV